MIVSWTGEGWYIRHGNEIVRIGETVMQQAKRLEMSIIEYAKMMKWEQPEYYTAPSKRGEL